MIREDLPVISAAVEDPPAVKAQPSTSIRLKSAPQDEGGEILRKLEGILADHRKAVAERSRLAAEVARLTQARSADAELIQDLKCEAEAARLSHKMILDEQTKLKARLAEAEQRAAGVLAALQGR